LIRAGLDASSDELESSVDVEEVTFIEDFAVEGTTFDERPFCRTGSSSSLALEESESEGSESDDAAAFIFVGADFVVFGGTTFEAAVFG
jgi:hypothetical protein